MNMSNILWFQSLKCKNLFIFSVFMSANSLTTTLKKSKQSPELSLVADKRKCNFTYFVQQIKGQSIKLRIHSRSYTAHLSPS